MESNDIDYRNLNDDSDSGRSRFTVASGAMVQHLDDDNGMMAFEPPGVTNMNTTIEKSSNVRIGHEIQYQAPVNIYVENLRFQDIPGNSGSFPIVQ
jgi:hypothetical protein